MSEFLTADHSCTTKCFLKNSQKLFCHLLNPVNLWIIFGNRQIASIKGKCRLHILEFFRMFKDSQYCELLTNLDAKCSKISLQMLTVQNDFVVHEWSAVKNSFITYVCYTPDGLFWLNLYVQVIIVWARNIFMSFLPIIIIKILFG